VESHIYNKKLKTYIAIEIEITIEITLN